MPHEVRLFIKTSLISLVLTSFAGTIYFSWMPLFDSAPPWFLLPMHIHLGVVGWLVNMVMGVALWMFPLVPGAHLTGRMRYPRTRVIIAYGALNGGLILRFVFEPLRVGFMEVTSGILQTFGIILCVVSLWPRIRSVMTSQESRTK